MAQPEEEIYIMSNRNEDEKSRLNTQHSVFLQITDNKLLHPSINRKDMLNVADVATGTGIWLEEVAVLLDDIPTSQPRSFHGFDLSAAMFPADHGRIKYSTHEVTKPFPEEHFGRYDLVHVRFLAMAIREEEIATIVTNLIELLRPGGYLQWNDIDLNKFSSFDGLIIDFSIEVGYSLRLTEVVQETCVKRGLQDVSRQQYSLGAKPWLAPSLLHWFKVSMHFLLPAIFMRNGRATGEKSAQKMASQLIDKVDAVPDVTMVSVLGRKQ